MRVLSFLALVLAVALPVRAQDPAAASAPTAPVTAPAAAAAAADAAAAGAAAEAPAAPAPTGTLSLTSTPAGKVLLDGVDTGLVTPVTALPVAVGAHTVKVVSDDGRTETADFTMDAGGTLSLNLTLPPAAPAPAPEATPAPAPEATPAPAPEAAPAPAEPNWTWMTVTGWTGLGLGTIGLLAGSVVITTPTDPDQQTLGFGLFVGGVGFVLGGAVLLYLDNELAESPPAPDLAAKPAS
ncbi:MAG: PEGA domain-containing protein [Deltaproteobacteria bacterium]|nr:PEGA domain-containing protein [Deltaproteobacteria bacterium]